MFSIKCLDGKRKTQQDTELGCFWWFWHQLCGYSWTTTVHTSMFTITGSVHLLESQVSPAAAERSCKDTDWHTNQTKPGHNLHHLTLNFFCVFLFTLCVCVCVRAVYPQIKISFGFGTDFFSHSAHFVMLFVSCGTSALIFLVAWRSSPRAEQTRPNVGGMFCLLSPSPFSKYLCFSVFTDKLMVHLLELVK